jgi:hypothetical protein
MRTDSESTLRFARIAGTLLLLGVLVGVVVSDVVPVNHAFAKEGHGKNGDDHDDRGKGNDKDKDKDDHDNRGKGNKKDKDDKPHDNSGNGNGEQIVVVPVRELAAVSTPTSAPTPMPAATPEKEQAGTLRVIAMSCSVVPAAGDDWEEECSQRQSGARFEVKALDGSLTGWFRSFSTDAEGVAVLDDLPPANYRLEQIAADWCHAESDNVDSAGNVIIVGGETTTVWIYNCPLATAKAA